MRDALAAFCAASHGGIADYAHAQCQAFAALGLHVTLLCPSDFVHPTAEYPQDRILVPRSPAGARPSPSRWQSRFQIARKILRDHRALERFLARTGVRHVLLATYSEYLAPLWAPRLRTWSRRGVRFGAVLHDPVRDYQVGPAWWHGWSVRQGYSFLDEVFLHERMAHPPPGAPPSLRATVIPHGPLAFPPPQSSRPSVRAALAIPESAHLFLAFGHLRDNKNLDLVISALASVPDAWLLVAGSEAPPGQRSSADYRSLAEARGVADRCRWLIQFLPEQEASDLFGAADTVVLAYASSFRSASGVLNACSQFRKPLLVSAGPSNLVTVTERYQLGACVAPDSESAIVDGMRRLLAGLPQGQWQAYLDEHSWSANARTVWTCLHGAPSSPPRPHRP